MWRACIVVLASLNLLYAHISHQDQVGRIWQKEEMAPFDELMLSWNASRPESGQYLFYVSVKTQEWSPWLLYGAWGSDGQHSCDCQTDDASVRVYQDACEVMGGAQATAFQIKVVAEGDASLEQVHHLHVYTNGDKVAEPTQEIAYDAAVRLAVSGLSQMTLAHGRNKDLCSPTSTAAVTSYLRGNESLDPIEFAQKSWDGKFDIFGNWMLNVAQASAELGASWSCWVERLSGFDAIYTRLHEGAPVVVSVRGPLPGSALLYAKGHLMAVVGYDPTSQKVTCMDPAFASDAETIVEYDLHDFLTAWNRRGRVAYVFCRCSS